MILILCNCISIPYKMYTKKGVSIYNGCMDLYTEYAGLQFSDRAAGIANGHW